MSFFFYLPTELESGVPNKLVSSLHTLAARRLFQLTKAVVWGGALKFIVLLYYWGPSLSSSFLLYGGCNPAGNVRMVPGLPSAAKQMIKMRPVVVVGSHLHHPLSSSQKLPPIKHHQMCLLKAEQVHRGEAQMSPNKHKEAVAFPSQYQRESDGKQTLKRSSRRYDQRVIPGKRAI